jgi:23S rRNA (uracil1939-C5)-methyltransferase
MGRRRVKEIQEVEISKVADKGYGLGHKDGKVIFVEQTVPGDVVDVRVYRNKKRYVLSYPLHFHKYSAQRVEPFCKHFGTCGGCKWQNLPYEVQLQHKQQLVADAMGHIGGIKDFEVKPIIGAEPNQYYRNKLEFSFSNRKWLSKDQIDSAESINRNALGFHVPRFFDKVLDIEHCYLQPEPSNRIRNFVNAYAQEHEMVYYDLQQKFGTLRNLFVRNNRAGEFMIILSVYEFNDEVKQLMDAMMEEFPELVSCNYVMSKKTNSSINDLSVQHYKGERFIIEKLGDIEYQIGPESFFQTNPVQAEALYQKVRELAEIKSDDRVYDLYTGLGSIALYVAGECQELVGIELVEAAIEDAKKNAALNGIENCRFYAGDMVKLLSEEFLSEQGKPDVIITDPPRAGMHDKVTRRIANSGARRIVYVSCNPATQARDLQILLENYDLKELQPVDMFPHTYHVENIAVLDIKAD